MGFLSKQNKDKKVNTDFKSGEKVNSEVNIAIEKTSDGFVNLIKIALKQYDYIDIEHIQK